MDHDQEEFDATFIHAAMQRAAQGGWQRVSLVEVARDTRLPVDEVRARFPFKHVVLMRLGRIADESALRDDGSAGTLRERIFDLLMRRFDVFQQYRDGIRAVLHALPYDPPLTVLLGAATMDTMRWIARIAGIDIDGVQGTLRLQGLIGVWTYALRAWEKDDSIDLSSTMAALDQALDKAERFGVLKETPEHRMAAAEQGAGIPDYPLELES